MLAADKQNSDDKRRIKEQKRAEEEAAIAAERALRPDHEYRYQDVTENFDEQLYKSIRQSEIDEVDAKDVASYEAKIDKDNADREK